MELMDNLVLLVVPGAPRGRPAGRALSGAGLVFSLVVAFVVTVPGQPRA